MANLIPKKENFLKQLFTNNRAKSSDERNDVDETLIDYYASLAMYHPDLIVVFSTEGKVLSENKSNIARFFGYEKRDRLVYRDLVSPDTYLILKSAFQNTLGGKSERHHITVKNKRSQIQYLALTFIPIKSAKKVIEGIYLIVQDITDYQKVTDHLKLKEKHLIYAQQVAQVGSWEYLIEENKLYCSDFFYDIFGFDKVDDLPMEKPFELVHPDDYKAALEKVEQAINKGVGYVSEFRMYHGKTNQLRYIRVKAEALWVEGKPYKLVGVIKDFTTQKQLELHLQNKNKELTYIFDHLDVGFWMREAIDGKILYASKGMEDILKTPLKRLIKEPDFWKDMILPVHRNEVMKAHDQVSEGKSIHIKYRITDGDGTTKWVCEQTMPTVTSDGRTTNIFGMVRDINHEMELQDKLNMLATHDPLTALPNQRSLYEKMDVLCKSPTEPFAVLSIDLDRFNVINDSLGYQVGDEILKKVANRMLSVIQEKGYIARLNSNNFIVILQYDSSKEDVFTLAEEMISKIGNRMSVHDFELHILSSIGISFYPEHGDNKLTLLESAQSALYHAKRQGKNRYQLYSFSKNISSYKKYILEQDMRKAIKNKEFELYYQPQVNPKSKKIEGAEALIRWNHKEWGTVSPGEFIPLAEENHLIHGISDWVIEQACSQLSKWKESGYTLVPISINISPIRFLKKGLVEFVEQQLALHQIPAKYLEMEITEGTLLKSESYILSTIASLKELGIKIAIDDFGTGHATLTYLRKFQVDTIKMDKIFIQSDDEKREIDQAIVSSVLHLARGLKIQVIAEGVESYAQYEFLKQNECDLVQGYLFSKPVSLGLFEKILRKGYLNPTINSMNRMPEKERRSYYRFEFPYCVLGSMELLELNKKKIKLGSTKVLIENVSLGGLKILSSLKLPINAGLKLRTYFKVLNEEFSMDGTLVWMNEGRGNTFYYGIHFDLSLQEEERLARIINRLAALRKLNQEIPDTNFIYQNAFSYLNEH